MYKLCKLFVLLLFYLGWGQIALAVINRTYQANSDGLNFSISNSGINRLQVEGDRIMRVISNEGECNIQHDMEYGYILLSSNVRVGENIGLTLISEKGLVQDLEIKVEESKVKRNIVIKTERSNKNLVQNESKEAEIMEAIKNIVFRRIEDFSFRNLDDDEVAKIDLPIDQFSFTEIRAQFATAAAISVFENNIYVAYRI